MIDCGKLCRLGRTIKRSFVYASIVLVPDLIMLAFFGKPFSAKTLTLILFLEGGLGLLAGSVIIVSATPSVAKAGELLFKTSSWSQEAERHAEMIGVKWMAASMFLVLFGTLVSALF